MSTLTCSNCHQPVRSGAKFCKRCGRPLAVNPKGLQDPSGLDSVQCANCGTLNRTGAKFCSRCRYDLRATPVAASPKRPVKPERARRNRLPYFAGAFAAAVLLLACVAGLIAYNAQNNAAPVAGDPTVAPTAIADAPNPTPEASAPTPTPTHPDWKKLEGAGYTLLYPPNWNVYQAPAGAVERTGVRYDLILSDAPGNTSPQHATPDETARVTVFYLPKPKQTLDEWVGQRWAWLETTLEPTTIDDAPALTATAFSGETNVMQEFFWLEARGRYYTVQAYARADKPEALDALKRIMDSLRLTK